MTDPQPADSPPSVEIESSVSQLKPFLGDNVIVEGQGQIVEGWIQRISTFEPMFVVVDHNREPHNFEIKKGPLKVTSLGKRYTEG